MIKAQFIYIHGFGSSADINNVKVQALKKLGPVDVVEYDYCADFATIEACLISQLEAWLDDEAFDVSIVIGTSLGGYWASNLSAQLGLAFIAINPALTPAQSLRKYDTISVKNCNSYEKSFAHNHRGAGLILLDAGDEIFDANETMHILEKRFAVTMYPGGNHRFTHIDDALIEIEYHCNINPILP